jgi:ATP adenylyltransferase
MSVILLRKGCLWDEILTRTEQARRSGALQPIGTANEFIEDRGVRFFVRVLSGLARKDEARWRQEKESGKGKNANPFLPYEEALFVADISETHVALLNKFNVVDNHLLIVTREFEDQETLLTFEDFEALWACMSEYNSLGFYNGGEAAGASQPHKHLQIVPLPLAAEGPEIPLEPLIGMTGKNGLITTASGLPFLNALVRFEGSAIRHPGEIARETVEYYREMVRRLAVGAEVDGRGRQTTPYCLLVTRSWMLLVPRSREFFDSISVNSLGFAGALLVRDEKQLQLLRGKGPMEVLKSVAFPLPPHRH